MKLRRITAGLAVLLLVWSMLSGCGLGGNKDNEEEDQIKTLYFYYPRDGSQILKRLILDYNQLQEQILTQIQDGEQNQAQNRFLIQGIEGSGNRTEFFEKLNELTEAGETVPDLILVHDTWLVKLAEEERIAPLDGGLSVSKKNEFFQGMNQALVWGDKTYGVPFWQDVPLLYYRTDLMETPPTSWTELVQEANHISQVHEMEYGLVFPGIPQENVATFLSSVWSFFGSNPDFTSKEIAFDETAMAAAWNSLKTMVESGTLPPTVLSMSVEDSRAVFEAGNAVFMWNWSYAARLFLDDHSRLYGKVGVTSLPVSDSETGGGRMVSGYALTMSNQTNMIPETWEVIQFLTSEAAQRKVADAGIMPAKKSLYQADWLNRIGLPADLPSILDSAQALNPGSNVDGTINMMEQAASLAISQNQEPEALILFVKEGMIPETRIDEEGEEHDHLEDSNNEEESSITGEDSEEE